MLWRIHTSSRAAFDEGRAMGLAMVLVMLLATALRPGQETPRCFFTSLLEI